MILFRLALLGSLLANALFSSSFYFTEERYSDALQRSVELKGEITFNPESLHIKYNKNEREIRYENSLLTLMESKKILELDEMQKQRISQYFEILLLLHKADEAVLSERFELKKDDMFITLYPKDFTADFLEKITLKKSNNLLKEVKLFLKNNDSITISIEDEIR